jgi:insulysin
VFRVTRLFRMQQPILKPLRDTREYKFFTLPTNKLRVAVISDKTADKAAAALDVKVGSFFDGPNHPGLAHFLEHMLFLGTKKYPDEAEYNKFLAQHGGYSNAYTSDTDTVYFFQVSSAHLLGALDRFAQFFVSPLLTESATAREVCAVNSEHMKNLQEDAWREHQLTKNLVFPQGHPGHHFSTGNAETLKDTPRDVLLGFHDKYYSANLMTLAVVGKESVEELETMVLDLFKDVKNNNQTVPEGKEIAGNMPLVNEEIKGKVVTMIPIKDSRKIQVDLYLPEQTDLWKSKPAKFLSHYLGHECKGSVLSVLKEENLVTDLSAGVNFDAAGVGIFRISVNLTEEAVKKEIQEPHSVIEKVTQTIFEASKLIGNSVPESMQQEVISLDALNFKFKSNMDSGNLAQTIATGLHVYPEHEVLSGPELVSEFNEALVLEHFKMINPFNMTARLIGKEFADRCNQEEPWYGTKFGIAEFPAPRLNQKSDELALTLPPENPFIPESTVNSIPSTPTRTSSELPTTLEESLFTAPKFLGSDLFYKPDQYFKLPKASMGFQIYYPGMQPSCRNQIKSDLFAQCVVESLNEDVGYSASLAGLKFQFKTESSGFHLNLNGYSEKMGVLLDRILEEIARPKFTQEIINRVVEKTRRNLSNQKFKKPYEEAVDLMHSLMLKPYYSIEEKLETLETLVKEGEHLKLAWDQGNNPVHVEGLIEGDLTEETAKNFMKNVKRVFASEPETDLNQQPLPLSQVLDLNQDGASDELLSRSSRNPEESNNACVVSIQLGLLAATARDSTEEEVIVSGLALLMNQIISSHFFDDLRTKQQLGYIVNAHNSMMGNFAVLNFIVQSEVPGNVISEKILKFIQESIPEIIAEIQQEDLDKYKTAVIKSLTEKPKHIQDLFSRHWQEISNRRFDFNRRYKKIVQALNNISLEELKEFAEVKVSKGKKVLAVVKGKLDTEEEWALKKEYIERRREHGNFKSLNGTKTIQDSIE